jgi:prevent-host-death family protein
MKLSQQIKPISYLKAHAAEIIRDLETSEVPLVVTQNGEAKVVMQGIQQYEESQETLALLKILALGEREIAAGEVEAAEDVVKRLRRGLKRL